MADLYITGAPEGYVAIRRGRIRGLCNICAFNAHLPNCTKYSCKNVIFSKDNPEDIAATVAALVRVKLDV